MYLCLGGTGSRGKGCHGSQDRTSVPPMRVRLVSPTVAVRGEASALGLDAGSSLGLVPCREDPGRPLRRQAGSGRSATAAHR